MKIFYSFLKLFPYGHNAGATPSTKPGRPWIIVYSEAFATKTEALQREKYIKKQKSRKYIEALIGSLAGLATK